MCERYKRLKVIEDSKKVFCLLDLETNKFYHVKGDNKEKAKNVYYNMWDMLGDDRAYKEVMKFTKEYVPEKVTKIKRDDDNEVVSLLKYIGR